MGPAREPHATLIYRNDFSNAGDNAAKELAADWAMEGKGIAACQGGALRLRSTIFTVPRDKDGHFNFWLKRDLPADLAIEWGFRFPPEGEEGLAIIFWGAKGRHGEDIFDPALPPRRGEVMEDYHSGAIDAYHLSFIARGRKSANLRKNYGFHLAASAPDLVTPAGANRWHKLRLSQYKRRIHFTVNGSTCIDWQDDGQTFGPVINTGGKMSFRQQNNLFYGEYRNLSIYALHE